MKSCVAKIGNMLKKVTMKKFTNNHIQLFLPKYAPNSASVPFWSEISQPQYGKESFPFDVVRI